MATQSVKTTYSLDVETVRALDELARLWGVSKSEALRRAIRASSAEARTEGLSPTQALDRLQRSLGLTARGAARWAAESRADRGRRSLRHETRAR